MIIAIALLVGVLAGTHTATWGMFKDAPHEGFTVRRYLRSVWVAVAIAPLAAWAGAIDPRSPAGAILLFGLVYALERACTEFYKTFLREEDQSKYFIPMQFHVLGRVVESRWLRLAVGLGVVAVAVLLLQAVRLLQTAGGPELPRLLLVVSLGGWFSACGGAFKDAPIEGFQTFKFFRSPAVAAAFGLLLAPLTNNWPVLALAAIGYTVASIETYKTFFFPSRPRGKFAGKPILFPAMLRRRLFFVPIYVFIWVVVLAGFAVSVPEAWGSPLTPWP